MTEDKHSGSIKVEHVEKLPQEQGITDSNK